MTGLIEWLIEVLGRFVIATISTFGYTGIVITMAIESACIPLPSEIIMPFSGYLVSTDQIPTGSIYKLYRREGESGDPHRHVVIAEAKTNVDETDGLEVTSTPLPGFPNGLVVAMNSGPRNFALFDWDRLFSGRK